MAAAVLLLGSAAEAAEIAGVQLPDTKSVAGKTLLLNGYGLRVWSFLKIPIYVAGLYLEHPNHDADAIIRSPETKVLTFRFEQTIDAERARSAWRTGLARNCGEPCQLDPSDVERFLAQVPAMHDGDSFELRFTAHTAEITANGRMLGRIDGAALADAVLAAFLGPKPGAPDLKQALLASRF